MNESKLGYVITPRNKKKLLIGKVLRFITNKALQHVLLLENNPINFGVMPPRTNPPLIPLS